MLVGMDTIKADYSGGTTFNPFSESVAVTVSAPADGAAFTANPNPDRLRHRHDPLPFTVGNKPYLPIR